ncbi:MAG: hypothetical protein Kow0032_17760 [Methyloligellaceae bacterium]
MRHHVAEHASLAKQVRLADNLIKRRGPQAVGKRPGGVPRKSGFVEKRAHGTALHGGTSLPG